MNTTKTTKRDFYNAIINSTEVTEEMRDYAKNLIEKMDIANAKKKATPKSKTLTDEQVALQGQVIEVLTSSDVPMTAKEVMTVIGDVSVQKVSARLKALSTSGQVNAVEPTKRKDPMLYELVK